MIHAETIALRVAPLSLDSAGHVATVIPGRYEKGR